ncbi:MAG: hypothetical protein NC299_14465 [Lachnospiraceae bacterium]|nr:hypothetical protein [Ruminococcus sp.]MCM1276539.1 hypothetical protein [Lachnospiraceae bacterium]
MDLDVFNSSKLERFRAQIDRQADEEISELTERIREKKNAAGKAKAEFAAREALARVHAEQNSAAARYKKEFSRCDFETTKAVRAHRNELIEGFFAEISEELSEFTRSDKYDGYLESSIARAEAALGKGCVIMAAVKDVDRVRALTKNEVRADSSIILGGICALDEVKGLFADLSIDAALADEKEKFSDKAELRL